MNEIIDFKNISENPENSSLSEKHFNSRIDLIKQKDNELIKIKRQTFDNRGKFFIS